MSDCCIGRYDEIETGLRSRRSTSDGDEDARAGPIDRVKGIVSAVFTGLSGGGQPQTEQQAQL